MAIPSGYTQSIRDGLTQKGVNPASVGYNKNTNYVTVDGKDAIKSGKNYLGTNYATLQGFNTDWGNYQKSLSQPQQPVEMTGQPPLKPTTQTQPQQSQPSNGNPYDGKVTDLIEYLLNQAKNPAPVDANAIYGSPQWAAQQAQTDRGAQRATRAAQESMGASGFGRSTALGERAQSIQNDANEYMNLQVLPMLMQQESAARQQALTNQFSALDMLTGQQGVMDTRKNSADNLAISKGQLTGNYLPPEAQALIDQVFQAKEGYSAAQTPEERDSFRAAANNSRAQLTAMGIENVDALFGAGTNLDSARGNLGGAGIKTLGARAEDRADDTQTFNQGVDIATLTGFMPDGTPTTAQQATELANLWKVAEQTGTIPDVLANLYGLPKGTQTQDAKEFAENLALDKQQVAISQQNANTSAASQGTSAGSAAFNKLMSVWEATGKAPAGLEEYGVKMGDLLPEKTSSAGGKEPAIKIDPKESSDLYVGLEEDFLSDELTLEAQNQGISSKELARSILKQNKKFLSDSDYSRLNSLINDNL